MPFIEGLVVINMDALLHCPGHAERIRPVDDTVSVFRNLGTAVRITVSLLQIPAVRAQIVILGICRNIMNGARRGLTHINQTI